MDDRINYLTNLKDIVSQTYYPSEQPKNKAQSLEKADKEYQLLKGQIISSNFFHSSSRHIRIRLYKWLHYLDRVSNNRIWLESRNRYTKLLSLMCYCQILESPFNTLPPEGDLPTIQKHQINKILDSIQRSVKQSAKISRRMSQVFNSSCVQKNNIQQTEDNFTHKRTITDYTTIPLKIIHSNQQSEDEILKTMFLKQRNNKQQNQQQKQNKLQSSPYDNRNQFKNSISNDITSRKPLKLNYISKTQKSTIKMKNQKEVNQDIIITKQFSDKKEYWESNSQSLVFDKQDTPKYLKQIHINFEQDDTIELVSYRQKDQTCCHPSNWFTDLLKKVNL